jgi:hypothetical protein
LQNPAASSPAAAAHAAPEFKQPGLPRGLPQQEENQETSWEERLPPGVKIGLFLVICVAAYLVMRMFL